MRRSVCCFLPQAWGFWFSRPCIYISGNKAKSLESAISAIRDYISGDRDARIECDDEGELYRLFQEVNSLVSILNAHAENEGRSKKFMKDTISDISHRLQNTAGRPEYL